MIVNIRDYRKRPYRFQKVNAVIEATWHDNSCIDADQSQGGVGPDYEEKEHCSLQEAIAWGNTQLYPVTLYIYDEDGGIYEVVP